MAKMKVYELAKELDKQSKEILTLLAEKGIEVKSHMSTIEDDAVEMVKSAFGKGKKNEAPPQEEKGGEESRQAKTDAAKAEGKKADGAKTEPPKKKKNIIFVSNPHNSKMGGAKQGGGQRPTGGNRPGGRPVSAQQQQYRPLPKPIIKPSTLPSIEEEFGAAGKTLASSQEAGDNRNQNRGGGRNEARNDGSRRGQEQAVRNEDRRQGGFGGGMPEHRNGSNHRESGKDGKRSFGGNEHSGRGDGRQGSGFRKGQGGRSFVPESPIKDTEKHRDEEKRRQGQERDRRSKKDLIYEEDDFGGKGRANKPGRFIKPENNGRKEMKVEDSNMYNDHFQSG